MKKTKEMTLMDAAKALAIVGGLYVGIVLVKAWWEGGLPSIIDQVKARFGQQETVDISDDMR